MDTYTEIGNKIRGIMGKNTPLLLTCKVEAVDGETCTVSVGDLKLSDVRLRSVVNGEDSKLLVTPKVGSYVTVIDLGKGLRDMEVVGYSEIEAIDIDTEGDIAVNCKGNVNIKCEGDTNVDCDGTITFNGGDNHGLAKVEAVAKKLKAIEDDINSLKRAFVSWVPVVYDGGASLKAGTTAWAAQQIQPTTKYKDLENDKVKH